MSVTVIVPALEVVDEKFISINSILLILLQTEEAFADMAVPVPKERVQVIRGAVMGVQVDAVESASPASTVPKPYL